MKTKRRTRTRLCAHCGDPFPQKPKGRCRVYCTDSCKHKRFRQAIRQREPEMRAIPYDVTDCDGCHLVERIPAGELVPDGWRRSLNGELRCPRCYERHILTICFRNQYPMPS